jgi:polar amino acid transport system substrate-binding protein
MRRSLAALLTLGVASGRAADAAAAPKAMPAPAPSAQPTGPGEGSVTLYTTMMGAYSDPGNAKTPGVLVELIQELCKRTGITASIATVPWSRAQHEVGKNDTPSLLFPLIRTAEREPDYQWVLHALNDRQIFYGLAGKAAASSIQELYERRIGVIRGSPFEAELQRLGFPHIDVAADATSNAKKLKVGRIDHWYVTHNTASQTFAQLDFPPSDFTVSYVMSHIRIYVAGNKSFPEAMAAKLQKAFGEVKKSGWYAALLERYAIVDAGEQPGPSASPTSAPGSAPKQP